MYGFYERFISEVEHEQKCSDCYGLSPLESKEDTDDEEESENEKDRIHVDEVLEEEGIYLLKIV